MKTRVHFLSRRSGGSQPRLLTLQPMVTASAVALLTALPSFAAPSGPTPQIPDGGGAPGAFPNTSVSGVNVIAKGSTTFNSSVEVSGFDGNGPIPWSANRYNRGDIALRLSPGNPSAALGNLGQGFIEFGDSSPGIAASQAWRPSPAFGVVLASARQNGPIDWNDGEGPFFPTVAVSWASSGPGYDMGSGAFANGQLDLNTGRAGTHGSSPEANFAFSTFWFPFDQGWLGGDVAGPTAEGGSAWTGSANHAAGLTPGLIRWTEFPAGSATYGGLAQVTLPGVNALEDGMLFAASSDGGSDVNVVGVVPNEAGSAWIVTIREDSATDSETLAAAGQSEFQFVYVPFNAQRLVGGHIVGSNGSKRKAVGDFTVTRTGTGTYELTFPGKTGSDGALLLQVADSESGTSLPMASRAFLSHEFKNGKFVVQARRTTTDTTADLVDVNFYVAWVDFKAPLAMPEGPRLRSVGPVVVSGEGVVAKDTGIGVNTDAPEILVTSIDSTNPGALTDPITQGAAAMALVGRFYNPRTLAPIGDPVTILGVPSGTLNRTDVKYNPVTKQYVVVATGRAYSPGGFDVPLIALVNSPAAGGAPTVKAWAHDLDTDQSYDDVSVAVSTANGNFLIIAERKFAGEGEGTVGVLYDKTGKLITPDYTRVDLLQQIGDEDDPDVAYLPDRDAFLYIANTDNSNGSTGTLGNRIVGSIINSAPDASNKLVVRPEQPLGNGVPAGRAEGHPASIENPFNGQLITAYDAGNGTAAGELSYFTLGTAPTYAFTEAQAEVSYLAGTGGNPLKHQHPQLAVDRGSGAFVLGFNATGSEIGIPESYAFIVLGPDGKPLPGQLPAPYVLAESPGGLGTTVNFHNIAYSPAADSFVAVYTSTPGVTYLASLSITSSHLAASEPPPVSIARNGASIVLSWNASATGFQLQSSPSVSPATWTASSQTPTVEGGLNKVTVTPTGSAQFYRLAKP
jgi:hypothetical protein